MDGLEYRADGRMQLPVGCQWPEGFCIVMRTGLEENGLDGWGGWDEEV